jgi:hypothetical protein
MVDALRRASRWLDPPLGSIIDLRPAHVVPHIELGLPDGALVPVGGLVVDDERRARHMAADLAIRALVTDGVFTVEREQEFSFYRYPESVDELRRYIATKWQHARLDDATYARAIREQGARPDGRLWLREQVAIRVLRPILDADGA